MRVGLCFDGFYSIQEMIELSKLADEIGMESIWMSDHLCFRDSLTTCMALLAATQKIKVAPAPMSPYSRTPIISAMSVTTMDEFAPGRVIASPGTGNAAALKEAGIESPHPLQTMREYVEILRRLLKGETVNYQGKMFQLNGAKMGFVPAQPIPMYITAVRSRMLELGGEIGDGVLLWLCDPPYVRDVVIPEVTKGRERAGKGLEGFDIVPAVPAAVTADRDATLERLRGDLVTYLSLPFYRSMLERSGFGGEIAGFDEGIAAGDVERAKASMSEAMLDSLGGFGGGAEVRGAVERYLDAGATSPGVSPVPTADFDATLAAGAELI